MTKLSFTQEYLLCALTSKGTLPTLRYTEVASCLVAGGLLELLYSDIISIEKNKLFVHKELPENQSYLKPLYASLQSKKPLKIEDVAAKYLFSTSTLLNEFLKSISVPMVEQQAVHSESGGVFHNKPLYIPNQQAVEKVVEKIRAEFLEVGKVDDETLILGLLLYKSGLLKNYFSKFESETLKSRIEEMKEAEANSVIKKIVDYVDTMIAVIASLG